LKERKKVQEKIRQVSDQEIFQKAMVNPDFGYYLIHFGRKYQESNLPDRVLY
ncbi:MAG: hypothetical protein US99_C0049G0001, partial [Candidatus Daviesbacteria bacterium GW2011_GWF2_38_6]